MEHRQRKDNLSFLWLFALLFFAYSLIWLIQSITVFAADDYFYLTFWENGWTGFVERNVMHYFTHNGRILVHLFAATMLKLGTYGYAFVNTVILIAICLLYLRLQIGQTRRLPAKTQAVALLLFAGFMLLIDFRVNKQVMMWICGASNYIFPVFVAGLAALLCYRSFLPERTVWICCLSLLLSFLAGATTEQGGVYTMVLVFSLWVYECTSQHKCKLIGVAQLLLCLLGYLTIFLSPATQGRVSAEFSLGTIYFNLQQLSANFIAPGRCLNIAVLFCAVVFISCLLDRCLPKVLYLSGPVGLFLCAGFFIFPSVPFYTIAFLVFCVFVVMTVVALVFFSSEAKSGFVLLAGLSSLLIMLLTESCSVRVTYPFLLSLILVAVHFCIGIYNALRLRCSCLPMMASIIFLLAGVMIFLPSLKGCWENHIIDQRNRQAIETARATQQLYYEDYNPYYCHSFLFESEYFETWFRRNYGLERTAIHYTKQYDAPFFINGQRCEQLTLQKDGEQFLPLRAVVEGLGGRMIWLSGDYLVFDLHGRTYTFSSPSIYFTEADTRIEYPARDGIFEFYATMYISAGILQEVFGIQIEQQQNQLLLTSGI